MYEIYFTSNHFLVMPTKQRSDFRDQDERRLCIIVLPMIIYNVLIYYAATDVNVPGRFYFSLKEHRMDSRLSQNITVVVFLTRLVLETTCHHRLEPRKRA